MSFTSVQMTNPTRNIYQRSKSPEAWEKIIIWETLKKHKETKGLLWQTKLLIISGQVNIFRV